MPAHVSAQAQSNGSNNAPYTDLPHDRAQSQWLFTPAELLKTPSILEGLPVTQELANRQKGVSFITQVGIMLKLPQLTLATASVFLHRFYMRYPMKVNNDKGIHHYQVAATALFLATKVEENCRKMKELIVACCRVAQKDPNSFIDEQSKEYWKWRDTILYHEDLLLEALCFDLQLEQPYRILFDYLCYYAVQDQKNLRNTSWAFLNDSHITTMCLMHSPKTIAGAALYAGIKLAGVTLPDDEQGRAWWSHLELDIYDIQKACNQMVEIYENPNIPRQGQKDAYIKDEDIMSFERTRRTQSPSFGTSPAHSARSTSQGGKREREDSWGHEHKNGNSDDAGHSEKMELDQGTPSSKRQRTGSAQMGNGAEGSSTSRGPAGADSAQTSRVPPTTTSRVPAAANSQVDDVQQRIDDIVNGSARNQGSHTQSTARSMSSQDLSSKNRDVSQPKEASSITDKKHENGQLENSGSAQNSILQSQRLSYPRPNEAAEEEEVDYGSEEGEV